MAERKLWEVSEKLSPRIRRLRDYYFKDEEREFQNSVMSFTTGIPNDVVYQAMDFVSVADMLGGVLQATRDVLAAMAYKVDLLSPIGITGNFVLNLDWFDVHVNVPMFLMLPVAMMGIAFSMIPGIMWPSVA